MWEDFLSIIKKSIKKNDFICGKNNQINEISNDKSNIKFSKKFEKNLLEKQDDLLAEEISKQYYKFLAISQKYNSLLDPVEKKKLTTFTEMKAISIKKDIKPTLIAVINQNNQIDAIFKKVDHAKCDSQKKVYLKNFLADGLNHFVMDDVLKEYKEQSKTEDDLAFADGALSK